MLESGLQEQAGEHLLVDRIPIRVHEGDCRDPNPPGKRIGGLPQDLALIECLEDTSVGCQPFRDPYTTSANGVEDRISNANRSGRC